MERSLLALVADPLAAEILYALPPNQLHPLATLEQQWGPGVQTACMHLWSLNLICYQNYTEGARPPEFIYLAPRVIRELLGVEATELHPFNEQVWMDDEAAKELNSQLWSRSRGRRKYSAEVTAVAPLPGLSEGQKKKIRKWNQNVKKNSRRSRHTFCPINSPVTKR